MTKKKDLKYVAVCIGINDYENYITLDNAVHDASAISDAFQNLKFEVIRLFNEEATVSAFDQLCNDLKERHEKEQFDAIILYFAGHGCMINLSDCLVLQDTIGLTSKNNYIVKRQSINVQDFINFFRDAYLPTMVVIIDACRTDVSNYRGVKRGIGTLPSPGIGAGVKGVNQAFIAYSTSIDTEADDDGGKDGHSPYTAALLDEIQKEMPIESVFKNVRNRIYRRKDDQLPWEYTCLTKDFAFNYGQLDPYYNADYSRDAFMYASYASANPDAKSIIDRLIGEDVDEREKALMDLFSKKSELSADDLFVIGRHIYRNAAKYDMACRQYLTSHSMKLFGDTINHLLRGVYYEIYFDENDKLRSQALGNSATLTIVDNLQWFLKNEDAAKFVKKYVTAKSDDILFQIWDTITPIIVDIEAEEMYCTDEESDNLIYGIRNVVVDGEEILSKMQMEIQSVVTKEQLRQQISECISIPLRRLKFKGLEEDSHMEHKYMMFYVDNIEQVLFDAINYSLPDEILGMSSNSYVDELYGVIISGLSYDGNELTLEGTCSLDIHNEMDHEEMQGCTLPCVFIAVLSYDTNSNSYEWRDGEFNVDTDSYYQ